MEQEELNAANVLQGATGIGPSEDTPSFVYPGSAADRACQALTHADAYTGGYDAGDAPALQATQSGLLDHMNATIDALQGIVDDLAKARSETLAQIAPAVLTAKKAGVTLNLTYIEDMFDDAARDMCATLERLEQIRNNIRQQKD